MNVERLQIFVGGFSGPSNYVEFSINKNGMGVRFVQSKDGRHYDFDEPTFGHFEVQESTLSTLQMQAFQTELKHINLKNWDEEYMDPFILDGTQWQIKIYFEDGNVRELFGSNAYPPQWAQFISILNHFIGKELL